MDVGVCREMMLKLLEIEEKDNILDLTSSERSSFKYYINRAMDIEDRFPALENKVLNMKSDDIYLGMEHKLYKEGYENARKEIFEIIEMI